MRSSIGILITTLSLGAQAQPTLDWVNNLGGFAFADRAFGVSADSADHTYVGGYFSRATDFDPGPGVVELTPSSPEDPYLAKYDRHGDLVWVRHLAGLGRITDIAVDSQDAVIAAGIYGSDLVVDATLTLSAVATYDIFFVKFDESGNLVWGRSISGNGSHSPQAVAVDSNDALLMSGLVGLTADLDPGPGTFEVTAGIDFDSFIAKFDSSGDFVWGHLFTQLSASGVAQSDSAHGLVVDPQDNVYLAGQYEGQVDFNGTVLDAGGVDAYLAKFSHAGALQWVSSTENDGLRTEHFALGIDGQNRLYAAGVYFGETDFDPSPVAEAIGNSDGTLDAYLVSYEPDGAFRWVRLFELAGSILDMVVAGDGTVTLGGQFSGVVDFDPGPDLQERAAISTQDCFFAQYNASGEFKNVQHLEGSPGSLGQATCAVEALAQAPQNDIVMAGHYRRSVDFDPGPGERILTPVGTTNGFVARYDQPLVAQIFSNGFEQAAGN
ncbi:MAG: hypothetical protein QNJ40_16430 [Xanthomonadales bacterium]|nr:hypothetical protein [Xanthomonadales bacterium]